MLYCIHRRKFFLFFHNLYRKNNKNMTRVIFSYSLSVIWKVIITDSTTRSSRCKWTIPVSTINTTFLTPLDVSVCNACHIFVVKLQEKFPSAISINTRVIILRRRLQYFKFFRFTKSFQISRNYLGSKSGVPLRYIPPPPKSFLTVIAETVIFVLSRTLTHELYRLDF